MFLGSGPLKLYLGISHCGYCLQSCSEVFTFNIQVLTFVILLTRWPTQFMCRVERVECGPIDQRSAVLTPLLWRLFPSLADGPAFVICEVIQPGFISFASCCYSV